MFALHRKFPALLVLAALAIVIGCGGEGGSDATSASTDGTTSTTATTSTTSGDTGGSPSVFEGSFSGNFSGTNTTSSRYTGTGAATIDEDGNAVFTFDATVSGAPLHSTFTGTLDKDGKFVGKRNSGEKTTGNVILSGDDLSAVLKWDKLTTSGSVFYSSTETFTLTRETSQASE